jgi:hypothetical protein
VPAASDNERGWRSRLAGIAQAPPRDLVAELAFERSPELAAIWREVLRAPERWLATVAVAVGRVLPVAQRLLAADRPQLRRLVSRIDAADRPEELATLLTGLHPRSQVSGRHWTLPWAEEEYQPPDDGLLVVPALTTPRRCAGAGAR